ncbi:MAG TPA: Na+/H+ antiporter, partial [Gemmatimonadaceae bacterium]|nr:Na+/H+ antiporter [Gemmatimonadaceae bacterium]
IVLGVLWHLVPGLPVFRVPPALALAIFLPPLLASAAYEVPLGAFRANLRPITLLAVGLVGVTMAAVAVAARATAPWVPWAAAFVLGAIVAPPDAVAATSVGGELGLENRLVTILEGEGLVNDATALVFYQLAVEAVVSGEFGWGHAAVELARSAPLGAIVGLAAGWGTAAVRRRLDEPALEVVISLIVPYIAYLAADALGGSAVIAVVALGFFLRRHATEIGTPRTRLTARLVWRTLGFLITGLVFVLVGLEIGEISTRQALTRDLLVDAAIVSGTVIVVRMAWMYVVPHVTRWLAHRGEQAPSWRELTVLGWAGMRGVVSLALALAVPATTAAGAPFPGRDRLILICFAVIAATLVLQGATLAPLIRALGVADPGARRRDEREARREAAAAARERLARLAGEGRISADDRAAAERLLAREAGDGDSGLAPGVRRALRAALDAERDAVLRRRDDGALDGESALRLELEIDLDEIRAGGDAAL